jgi:drug/metabolite transporter (DMT)-like permease
MQQRAPLTLNATTWILLILLGFIWGGSFFFARYAVAYVPPFTLVFLRLSLAALALHLYLRGGNNLYQILRTRWRGFILLGLINNAIPHTLIFLGQTEIGAGLASILNATTPIWTVLIANKLTADEKLSPAKIAGTILGLSGTAVLIGPSTFLQTDVPLWAVILPILAAVSYGFAATYGKRFRDVPAPVTAAGQLTASSILMLPAALVIDQALVAAHAAAQRDCSHSGLGTALDRFRLYPVLPDHGGRWRHQCVTGDAARSTQRNSAGRTFPWRNSASAGLCRDGPDRRRAACAGRPDHPNTIARR